MDAAVILQHLQRLYESGEHSDCSITIKSKTFRLHKVVLSQSNYFAALMSAQWRSIESCSPPSAEQQLQLGRSPAMLEWQIEVDDLDDSISILGMEAAIKFLYGFVPALQPDLVQSLLRIGSFFDVPALCSLAADYVFSTLSFATVVDSLLMVHDLDFGEPGKLIDDASFAFLYRNAVDTGGAALSRLPLPYHKKLLLASELYTASEFQRYKLAVTMKAAARSTIFREMARAKADAAAAAARNGDDAAQRRRASEEWAQEEAGGAGTTAFSQRPSLRALPPSPLAQRQHLLQLPGHPTAAVGNGTATFSQLQLPPAPQSTGSRSVGRQHPRDRVRLAVNLALPGTHVPVAQLTPAPTSVRHGSVTSFAPNDGFRATTAATPGSTSLGMAAGRSAHLARGAGGAGATALSGRRGAARSPGGTSLLRLIVDARSSTSSASGAGGGPPSAGGPGTLGGHLSQPPSPPIWTTSISGSTPLAGGPSTEGRSSDAEELTGDAVSAYFRFSEAETGPLPAAGGVAAEAAAAAAAPPNSPGAQQQQPPAAPIGGSLAQAAAAEVSHSLLAHGVGFALGPSEAAPGGEEAETAALSRAAAAAALDWTTAATSSSSSSSSSSVSGSLPTTAEQPRRRGQLQQAQLSARLQHVASGVAARLQSIVEASQDTGSGDDAGGAQGSGRSLAAGSSGNPAAAELGRQPAADGPWRVAAALLTEAGSEGVRFSLGIAGPSSSSCASAASLEAPPSSLASGSNGGGYPAGDQHPSMHGLRGAGVGLPPPFGAPSSSRDALGSLAAAQGGGGSGSEQRALVGSASGSSSGGSITGGTAQLPTADTAGRSSASVFSNGPSSQRLLHSAHQQQAGEGSHGGDRGRGGADVPNPPTASSLAPLNTPAAAAAVESGGGIAAAATSAPPPPPTAAVPLTAPAQHAGAAAPAATPSGGGRAAAPAAPNGNIRAARTSVGGLTTAAAREATATTTLESDASQGDPDLHAGHGCGAGGGGSTAGRGRRGSGGQALLPQPPPRDFESELAELEDVYAEVFSSVRFVHFSQEQLQEAATDGAVSPHLLAEAATQQQLMLEKLQVARTYNVRRLSELDALSEPDAVAVRDTKWPPFRFGVEVAGVFSDAMAPSSEGQPQQTNSERVAFAGSLWCLDLKRYISPEDGAAGSQEFVAVYLRRRSLASPPATGPFASFEDSRDHTTMGFSIRLCGSPGAPTSNSVCGRSVMGKAFGINSEQSWGWESMLTTSTLTERPWSLGDKLRFVINLDLL